MIRPNLIFNYIIIQFCIILSTINLLSFLFIEMLLRDLERMEVIKWIDNSILHGIIGA